MLNMKQINDCIVQYDIKLSNVDNTKLIDLDRTLGTLTPLEICKYQEAKSIAQLENKIDLETAMWIYNTLSNWSTVTLSERILLTQLFARWLGATR